MNEAARYRYGLGPDQYVVLSYDAQPTSDDLDLLIEYIRLHRRCLAAGHADRDEKPAHPQDPSGAQKYIRDVPTIGTVVHYGVPSGADNVGG